MKQDWKLLIEHTTNLGKNKIGKKKKKKKNNLHSESGALSAGLPTNYIYCENSIDIYLNTILNANACI